MILPMERLRAWLNESETTQLELAKALGVSQPTVSDWINGFTSPTAARLRLISEYTGISIDELLAAPSPSGASNNHAAA